MAIFDELRSIAKTLKEADKIPQFEQILNVQEKLLEMQNKIFKLEKENKELKENLNLKQSLSIDRNAYWIVNDKGKDGPFCTKCKDSEDKMIRMRIGNYKFGWAYCPNCKQITPK